MLIILGQFVISILLLFFLIKKRRKEAPDNYSGSNNSKNISGNRKKQPGATGNTSIDDNKMKEICDKVTEYLQSSKAYKNKDFNMATLSLETGIHHKNISGAINNYLHKNFFELVNNMRIEEAKRLLTKLNVSGYTIESIYTECGFRSRSTFFMTFKKFEGVSPAKWLTTLTKNKSILLTFGLFFLFSPIQLL
jgi:AraC-like DNA-binding protein